MPIYDYKCSECGHTFTRNLRIANRKEPIEQECPSCMTVGNISQVLGGCNVADPVRIGRIKPEAGFNEVLRNIKKGNPGSNFNIRD